MRATPYKALALALALIMGQWLSLVHGLQHPATLADADCTVCIHISQLGSGAPSFANTAPSLSPFSHETPLALSTQPVLTAPFFSHLIRGPPGLLA